MEKEIVLDTDALLASILKKATMKRERVFEDATPDVVDFSTKLINESPELDKSKAAKVKYLFRSGSWSKWGECARTTGKWRHLTDYDFVITLHKDTWDTLSEHQRNALLHHELSHIDRAEEKWTLARHDIEEFLTTFKRFGAWHGNLQMMVQADTNSKLLACGSEESGERS